MTRVGRALRVSVISKDVTTYRVNPHTDSNVKEFSVDAGNTHFKSIDGVLCTSDGDTLVRYPPSRDGTFYYVPEHVKYIGPDAFAHIRTINHIVLSKDVEKIGARAFASSIKLTHIEIGEHVRYIDATAFSFCYDLEGISVHPNNPYFRSVNGCLLSNDYSTLVYVPVKVRGLPDLSRCRFKTQCATADWDGGGNAQLCSLALTPTCVVEF